MAAIASFLVAHENGQCQTRRPRKPIYTGFKEILKKKKIRSKKKFSCQVATILIIG